MGHSIASQQHNVKQACTITSFWLDMGMAGLQVQTVQQCIPHTNAVPSTLQSLLGLACLCLQMTVPCQNITIKYSLASSAQQVQVTVQACTAWAVSCHKKVSPSRRHNVCCTGICPLLDLQLVKARNKTVGRSEDSKRTAAISKACHYYMSDSILV